MESPVSPLTAACGSDPSSSSAPPENPPEKTQREIFRQNDETRGGKDIRQMLLQITSCFIRSVCWKRLLAALISFTLQTRELDLFL